VKDPSPRDEAVLAVVARIPRGRLTSYGDIAALLSEWDVACTPRQVAGALARYGAGVPWWRVVQSAGTLAPAVAEEAAERLRAEGIAVRGRRVPLGQARWMPDVTAPPAPLLGGGAGD